MIEYVVIAAVALVCGGIIGHYMGKNPAAESQAMGIVRAELTSLRDTLERAAGKLHAAAQAQAATPAPVAAAPAPAAEPVSVAPAVPWTLGDSYSSLSALAADIARPGFGSEIRIDGSPIFNIGNPWPIDFYTVGGQLTQTKPAAPAAP